jgi:DNA mismatch repair ATPase MutS
MYNFVKENKALNEYLKNMLPDFVSLIDSADNIIKYLNDVLIIDDCKDIDNITKIEKSFIKNGVDKDLDNKIKTLMDSHDQLEACRSYFSLLISNYETEGKTKKSTKKKKSQVVQDFTPIGLNQEDDEDVKEYVTIHETDKNNFTLLATERRCKILDEIIKHNNSVKLTYYSSFSGLKTEFTLSLDLEYNKQTQSKKSITNSEINSFCKNVGSIKVNLIDTVSNVYQQIVKKLQDYQYDVERISNFITYVDLVYTKAFIASKYNYCLKLKNYP